MADVGGEVRLEQTTKVAVLSSEPVGARMTGPAVRAWEIARGLQGVGAVHLLAPESTLEAPFPALPLGGREARRLLRDADVVIAQGFGVPLAELIRARGDLVFDLYYPLSVEVLERQRRTALDGWELAKLEAIQRFVLRRGDFFLCATERQRAFWLGALLAEGTLSPVRYAADPSARSLIDVVAFGVPDEPATARGRPARQRFPGIGETDPVLVWNGGIWKWLDAATLLRAMAVVVRQEPRARLVFMAGPPPSAGASSAWSDARALSAELALLDRWVFFHEHWVPYEERADWLLDAQIALCLHPDTLEASLSYRTRLVDCLWAHLPIICTDGDYFAELVRGRGLGRVVPAGDAGAVASAVLDLLAPAAQHEARSNLAAIAPAFRWSRVLEPLRAFCRRAPRGRLGGRTWDPLLRLAGDLSLATVRHARWRHLPGYAAREIRRLGGSVG